MYVTPGDPLDGVFQIVLHYSYFIIAFIRVAFLFFIIVFIFTYIFI